MKVAFCFLTQADLHQPGPWERFFASASPDSYSIYCHPKNAEGVTSPLLKDSLIADRVPTSHAHVSIVRATIKLFEAAYAGSEDNQYFVLLSESTVPLVPLARLRAELESCAPRSLISYRIPPPNTDHHRRLQKVEQNGAFAETFFHHDQWVILHRRHVGALLADSSLDRFSNAFAPDEHYFMNVLVHLKQVPLDEIINRRTTFVNWKEPEQKYNPSPISGRITLTTHPKTYQSLSPADLAAARSENCWFFRKVSAGCDCGILLRDLNG